MMLPLAGTCWAKVPVKASSSKTEDRPILALALKASVRNAPMLHLNSGPCARASRVVPALGASFPLPLWVEANPRLACPLDRGSSTERCYAVRSFFRMRTTLPCSSKDTSSINGRMR
jgi:hypothetical protein